MFFFRKMIIVRHCKQITSEICLSTSVAVARYGSFFRLAESKFILRIFRKLFIYSA